MKINASEKLKIELADLIKIFLVIIFVAPFIVSVIAGICTKLNIGDEDMFSAIIGIIYLVGLIPLYMLYYTICCQELNTLIGVISISLIITVIEALIYTLLYYRQKNIYELISTNGKKIDFKKIYTRNVLKSISRQFCCIGLITLIFKGTALYDIILNTDMVSKKENKNK